MFKKKTKEKKQNANNSFNNKKTLAQKAAF